MTGHMTRGEAARMVAEVLAEHGVEVNDGFEGLPVADVCADSFAWVAVLVRVELAMGQELPDDVLESAGSVGAIIDAVLARR